MSDPPPLPMTHPCFGSKEMKHDNITIIQPYATQTGKYPISLSFMGHLQQMQLGVNSQLYNLFWWQLKFAISAIVDFSHLSPG